MPFFAPSSRKASKFAIAAAIMSVGAFGVTAFDAPAAAKRDKKSEPKYSDEFRETIAPIQEALEAEGALPLDDRHKMVKGGLRGEVLT